jgi:hypothetical protein
MLQRFRLAGDPLADQAIEAFAAWTQGKGAEPPARAVGALIPRLVAVPRPDPADLPAPIAAWLAKNARLPAGTDLARLDRASALWVKHGVTMAMILGTASLAECYAAARGIRALTFSNRLQADTLRRLRETVLWVNLIMLPGGLCDQGTPTGEQARPGDPPLGNAQAAEGIRAVYKVRLMHAAIRYLIAQSGRWPAADLGVPLCQEDLAGTLMTFACTVPRSLRRLGVRLTDAEAEDYLYFWSVVGEMMGVHPDLIPADLAGAGALTALIFRRQHAASPEGAALTQAMLQTYGGLLPGRVLDRFFPALIRYLSGDEVADLLGVPASPRWVGVRHVMRLVALADFGWRASCLIRGTSRKGCATLAKQSG